MIRVETTHYGKEALNRLTTVVAELKAGDPMAPVTILAPNNIAGIVARRHLAAGLGDGSTGVAAVEITTLPRLAERLAAHTLAPRRPATRTVTAAAWRDALTDAPGIFELVSQHPATIRALVGAHPELRDLSADAREALSSTTTLSPDLVRLHQRVTSAIDADWYDETTLLTAATGLVSQSSNVPSAILYLPQALTLAEAAFTRALAATSGLVVIAGLTGAQRADDAVRRSLSRIGVEASEVEDVATAGTVINASDSDDEVRCVARDVVATLRSVPGHRIAILYGASSPYARLLSEQLTEAGITYNGPGIRAVNERAVARTILEVLALVDHDFPRADLFRALANAPVRDLKGAKIPLSRWEQISRSAGVVRGDDWALRLDAFIHSTRAEAARKDAEGDQPWLVERLLARGDDAAELRAFVSGLRQSFARAGSFTSWQELAAWADDLFSTLIGANSDLTKLPADEQYAVVAVRSILSGCAILDTVDRSASLIALRDVLDLELAAAIPRVGKLGEGVLVAPISAAVGLSLDVVYVVGLSEDTYPGRLREDALLPERARASVPEELASYRESLHARYRALLIAMASAPRVVATFPRGDLRRSTQRLPSRWLLPTLRELAGDKRLPATEWDGAEYGAALVTSGSFAGELLSTTELATEQEWRTRAAVAGSLEDRTVSSAHELIDARAGSTFSRFDGNLAGLNGLPNYALGDKLVSPTALESYASCPHAFFVKRLLGIEPLEQPEDSVTISPMDIGNLVHESFDQLVTEFEGALPSAGQPWSAAQRARLIEIAEEKGREFEERGLTGHPTLWGRERHRVASDLINMLEADDAWRRETSTAVTASELPFGQQGREPVEIIVPSGKILMRGSADKVDVAADGTLFVTDIKTGSRRTFKEITQDDPVVGGTKLQLPVYAYAARERFGDRATPVVTAYWFVRRDPGRVEIALTPKVEAQYATTLDVIVRSISSGLFPAKAPEKEDFSWVQCPYCNPDGIGHGAVREQWERKRTDRRLHELVSLIDASAVSSGEKA